MTTVLLVNDHPLWLGAVPIARRVIFPEAAQRLTFPTSYSQN